MLYGDIKMIYYCEICDKNITAANEQEYICDRCNKIICEDCSFTHGGISTFCPDCEGKQ